MYEAREGRLPIPSRPTDTYFMDVCQLRPAMIGRTRYSKILGLIDHYSSFLVILPIKDETVKTILEQLSKLFSIFPVCRNLVTDNAKVFCSEKYRLPLLNMGITHVTTVSPNSSTSNALIERSFRMTRAILRLNLTTFKRESNFSILYSSIQQYNCTPRKNLRKYVYGKISPSPMELFYGLECRNNVLDDFLKDITPNKQKKYHEDYNKIIQMYEIDKEKEHQAKIDRHEKSTNRIEVGDYVLLMNPKRKKKEIEAKGENLYLSDIYEVLNIHHRKAKINPVFTRKKPHFVQVNDLKKYQPHELVLLLPKELRVLCGNYQEMSSRLRNRRPPSLMERRLPLANIPELRNKKLQAREPSIPAIRDPLMDEPESSTDEEDEDWKLWNKPKFGGDNQQIIIPEDENLNFQEEPFQAPIPPMFEPNNQEPDHNMDDLEQQHEEPRIIDDEVNNFDQDYPAYDMFDEPLDKNDKVVIMKRPEKNVSFSGKKETRLFNPEEGRGFGTGLLQTFGDIANNVKSIFNPGHPTDQSSPNKSMDKTIGNTVSPILKKNQLDLDDTEIMAPRFTDEEWIERLKESENLHPRTQDHDDSYDLNPPTPFKSMDTSESFQDAEEHLDSTLEFNDELEKLKLAVDPFKKSTKMARSPSQMKTPKGRGTPPAKDYSKTPPPPPKVGRGRGAPVSRTPVKTLLNVPSPIQDIHQSNNDQTLQPSKKQVHGQKVPPIVKPVGNLDKRLNQESTEGAMGGAVGFNPFAKSKATLRTPPQQSSHQKEQQSQSKPQQELRRTARETKPVDRYGSWDYGKKK